MAWPSPGWVGRPRPRQPPLQVAPLRRIEACARWPRGMRQRLPHDRPTGAAGRRAPRDTGGTPACGGSVDQSRDPRQGRLRAIDHGHRHGMVEGHDRRRRQLVEPLVQRDDGAPVGGWPRPVPGRAPGRWPPGPGTARRARGGWPAPARPGRPRWPTGPSAPGPGPRAAPARPACVQPRRPARLVEQHQGQQAVYLRPRRAAAG